MRFVPVFAMLALAGCGDSEKPVVADDGRYAITFPGPTTTRDETVPVASSKEMMTVHIAEWKHANIDRVHAFTWTDLPVNPAKYDTKKGIDGAVAGLEQTMHSKVRDEQPVTFGAFQLPGRQVLMQHNTRSLWTRALVVLDTRHMRLYTVSVEGGREYVNGPEADGFFESFVIAK